MLSLENSTISNFKTGVELGPDSMFNCEATGFVGIRGGGCAIHSINPALFRMVNGSIYKGESDGIVIELT
jgi:hypothetical protein